MYDHLMIDLETMDNMPGGVINSIGAAFFDPFDDYEKDFPDDIPLFYRNIDIDSCLESGLSVGGDTINWWLNQDKEAIKALTDPKPEKLRKVVYEFNTWYWDHREDLSKILDIDKSKVKLYVWSHGATFDLPFWSVASSKVGKRTPWQFRNCRDTRTLFDIALKGKKGSFEGLGTKHNSLHDSLTQIIWVQEAYRKLGLTRDGYIDEEEEA